MKKVLLTVAMVALMATPSFAIISGTLHDFTAQTWSNGEICLPCHTPHGGDTTVGNAPLWNHEVSVATYTPYATGAGTTMEATGLATAASGISALCLSCHDGSVALDSFGGVAGSTFITGAGAILADGTMANDHPISFVYDSGLATADGFLRDPATFVTSLGGFIDADMLFATKIECASCHDVHDSANNGSPLLVINNAGSALCVTCHIK